MACVYGWHGGRREEVEVGGRCVKKAGYRGVGMAAGEEVMTTGQRDEEFLQCSSGRAIQDEKTVNSRTERTDAK